jgi:hypothetical protein
MFKKSKASSVKEYLAAVPKEKQEIVNFLHKFIQKNTPGLVSA